MWAWGSVEEEKKRLGDLLKGIASLKEDGLDDIGAVGAFFAHSGVLLGVCPQPMYRKVTDTEPPVLTEMERVPYGEVTKWIRRVLNAPRAKWTLEDRLVALLDTRAVALVSV